MEFIGSIKGITVDYMTNETVVTVTTAKKPAEIQQQLLEVKDKICDCKFSIHYEKKSRNANAYFHVLNSKLAEKLEVSFSYMKNYLIYQYGQPLHNAEGECIEILNTLPAEIMHEQEELKYGDIYVHFWACGSEGDLTLYKVYRGVRSYNTKEMARLIDGAVFEAKQQGIEVKSPEEVQRMMEEYEKCFAKK